MTVKLAFPTGDPRPAVGELLVRAGIPSAGYEPGSRLLRNELGDEGLTLRVFREQDIPIQVALGNYDLGICGDVWLTELQARFPLQRIVRIGSLPGPRIRCGCARPRPRGRRRVLCRRWGHSRGARIAAELPNLADLVRPPAHPGLRAARPFGVRRRVSSRGCRPRAHPGGDGGGREAVGLVPLARVFEGGLALIANADALGGGRQLAGRWSGSRRCWFRPPAASGRPPPEGATALRWADRSMAVCRVALPDGHAQRHTFAGLTDAGLRFAGYEEKTYVRRPETGIDGLEAKVVRPQDMPQLVARGDFDAAVTGIDVLSEHLARFPSSPVELAVDLGRSRYRIGPVVERRVPGGEDGRGPSGMDGARAAGVGRERVPGAGRAVGTERAPRTQTIIPIAGASEGFVPGRRGRPDRGIGDGDEHPCEPAEDAGRVHGVDELRDRAAGSANGAAGRARGVPGEDAGRAWPRRR